MDGDLWKEAKKWMWDNPVKTGWIAFIVFVFFIWGIIGVFLTAIFFAYFSLEVGKKEERQERDRGRDLLVNEREETHSREVEEVYDGIENLRLG